MSFQATNNLSHRLGNLGVLYGTSPAAAFYRGRLYVFYAGCGRDGMFFVSMARDGSWSNVDRLNNYASNVSSATHSSPNAVVYNDKLYVFYNGSGNDGTWYTAFDGNSWSSISSVSSIIGGMSFLPETSPSAAVYQNKLYLFWNGGGDDGLWYCTLDGNSWSGQTRVDIDHGVANGTSPCAVSFNQQLYLFWNGVGYDGAWFSSFNGGHWNTQTALWPLNDMGFLSRTSPSAVVLKKDLLRLLWVGSGGSDQGLWYSDFNTQSWSTQRNMANEIGSQDLGDRTHAGTAVFNKLWSPQQSSAPGSEHGDGDRINEFIGKSFYVFWRSPGTDLLFSNTN